MKRLSKTKLTSYLMNFINSIENGNINLYIDSKGDIKHTLNSAEYRDSEMIYIGSFSVLHELQPYTKKYVSEAVDYYLKNKWKLHNQ